MRRRHEPRKARQRYLRRGDCAVCGRVRSRRTRRGRPSRRFCNRHLHLNRVYVYRCLGLTHLLRSA